MRALGRDRERPAVGEPLLDLGERRQPVLLEHAVGVVARGRARARGAESRARSGSGERVARLEALDDLLDVRPRLPGAHRRPDAVEADLPAGAADLAHRREVGHDRGHAAGLRLEHRQPEPLAHRRVEQHVERGVDVGQVLVGERVELVAVLVGEAARPPGRARTCAAAGRGRSPPGRRRRDRCAGRGARRRAARGRRRTPRRSAAATSATGSPCSSRRRRRRTRSRAGRRAARASACGRGAKTAVSTPCGT